MKKYILLVMVFAVVFSAGCGSQNAVVTNEDNHVYPDTNESSENKADTVDLNVYQPPAEVVNIDLEAADPSNDGISFSYDTDGRVVACHYQINGQPIDVSYLYEDNSVAIYAFMGDYVAAEEHIPLEKSYNPAIGFSVVSGYYLKGF